jgi:hypothetical protein
MAMCGFSMSILIFYLFTVLTLVYSEFNETELLDLVKLTWPDSTFPTAFTTPIVGFYHIHGDSGHFKTIVSEQAIHMRHTGVLDKLDTIYFVTTGSEKADLLQLPNEPKFKHLHHFHQDGEETYTLGMMSRFCHKYPTSKILYFHNKYSSRPTSTSELFRKLLNCFVLTPNCLTALETGAFDTCGWRISPAPHPHYPGNFFWSKCSYINTLIDPWSIKTNRTFIDLTSTLSGCIGSNGRYFAETWITSAPIFQPADCMSVEMDSSYLYGYKFPTNVLNKCPDPTGHFGYQCATASTLSHAESFTNAFQMMKNADLCHQDLDEEITKRSQYWYGQPPTTYLQWINRIKMKKPEYPAGTTIRAQSEKAVYLYRGGKLHVIPDKKTFEGMGLDWDEIKVIPDFMKSLFVIGEPVQSL